MRNFQLTLLIVLIVFPILAHSESVILEFQAGMKISRSFVVFAPGHHHEKRVYLYKEANSPFTVSDGYCFQSGMINDDAHFRVRYNIGFNRESGHWNVHLKGGSVIRKNKKNYAATHIAIRCIRN